MRLIFLLLLLLSSSLLTAQTGFFHIWGDQSKSDIPVAVQTSANGTFIAGYSGSNQPDNDDVFLIKVDQQGAAQFTKYYGGPDNEQVTGFSAGADGLFISGFVDRPLIGDRDYFIIKTDFAGNILWRKENTSLTQYDEAADVQATGDGGCIALINSTNPVSGKVVRYDAAGGDISQEILPNNVLYKLKIGTDDEIFLTGTVSGEGFLRKITPLNPSQGWTVSLTLLNMLNMTPFDMEFDPFNQKVFVTGNNTNGFYYLIIYNAVNGSPIAQSDDLLFEPHISLSASGNIIIGEGSRISLYDPVTAIDLSDSGTSLSDVKVYQVNDVLSLADGRIMFVGPSTQNQGGEDALLGFLNADLTLGVTYLYGEIALNHNEVGWAVQRTADGGYVMAGQNYFEGKNADYELTKINAAGQIEWANHYGSPDKSELCRSVEQTPDGGFIMSGQGAEWHIVKTSADGTFQWERDIDLGTYGGIPVSGISPHPQGGYYAFCRGSLTGLSSTSRPLLIRLNESGDTLWTQKVGPSISHYFRNLIYTNDGGYAATGWHSAGAMMIKFDANGNVQWEEFEPNGLGYGITQLTDGSIVFSGIRVGDLNYDSTIYVHKFTQNGTPVFKKYINMNNAPSYWYRVEANATGELLLSGYQASPDRLLTGIGFIKLDTNADVVYKNIFYTNANLVSNYGVNAHDGGRIAVGKAVLLNTEDYLFVKTNAAGTVESTTLLADRPSLNAGPSPSAGDVTLNLKSEKTGKATIRLFDLTGRCVFERLTEKKEPQLSLSFNLNTLPDGNYFWQVCINGQCAGTQWAKQD